MLYSSKSTRSALVDKVSISGKEMDFVENFTHLGITLDSNLSFVKNYKNAINRLKQKYICLAVFTPLLLKTQLYYSAKVSAIILRIRQYFYRTSSTLVKS